MEKATLEESAPFFYKIRYWGLFLYYCCFPVTAKSERGKEASTLSSQRGHVGRLTDHIQPNVLQRKRLGTRLLADVLKDLKRITNVFLSL